MNDTEVKIKFSNSVTNLSSLEKYAQSLEKLKTFLNSIDSNDIVKIEDATKTLGNTAGKNKKKFETAFDIQVLKQFGRKLEQLVTSLSSYTKKSADFLENWNLLDVAFQNNTKEAEKLVNTLSEMYGLDESWGYRTVGLFKQLANAMGLTDEVGTQLSKTLTQLAIDTSSLYNIDVEDTVSILQSGLAGQTKPVRRLGADITQTTLQVTLDSYGINETINELSYAEKRLVIVTALLNQTEEAQGDWGRTIESTANQMRIFDQQLERLTRALGDALMPLLQTLLPIINGVFMVLVELANMIAEAVEKLFSLFGYEPEEDFFSGVDDSVINLQEDLEGASESAKKLQSGLRSFDKLNNIKTPTTTETSGVGGGVDPRILDMFNEASSSYLDNLDKIQMRATKIRDIIMEWLGFSKEIDENTGDVSFKFKKLTSGTILGSLAVGGIIYNGFVTISKVLAKFGIISKPLPNIFKLLSGAISKVVLGISTLTGLSVGWVVAIGVAIAGLVTLIVTYWDEIKEYTTQLFSDIGEYFVGIWESFVENIVTPISDFVSSLAETIYNSVIQPIIEFFQPIVEAVIEIFDLIFKNIAEIVVGVGKAVWEIIKKVGEIFSKILEIFIALGKSFYTYILDPILDFIGGLFKKTYNKVIQPILDVFSNVGKWVYDKIISPILDKITWLRDKAVGIFKSIGTTVVDFIGGSIKSVLNGIFSAIEGGINFFIGMLNGAIDVINAIPGVSITKLDLLSIPRLKTGMDFVPNDYYPAFLDYGERVLTKEENADYNKGIIRGENAQSQPMNATFVIQIGDKEIARTVLNDLQDMAKSNGKPITIG